MSPRFEQGTQSQDMGLHAPGSFSLTKAPFSAQEQVPGGAGRESNISCLQPPILRKGWA